MERLEMERILLSSAGKMEAERGRTRVEKGKAYLDDFAIPHLFECVHVDLWAPQRIVVSTLLGLAYGEKTKGSSSSADRGSCFLEKYRNLPGGEGDKQYTWKTLFPRKKRGAQPPVSPSVEPLSAYSQLPAIASPTKDAPPEADVVKPTPPTAPRPAVTTSTRRSFTSTEETQAAPAVDLSEYKVVHILGGPGAGKGTQGEKIVAKYGCHHFSAGDLLRAEVASGSEQGNEIDALMKEGELVPQSVTISLLRKAIETSENPELGFLLDGFPRAIDQAETFEAEVTKGKLMLWLDCSEDTMTERLLKRGETSGRADDNAEAIKKRFHTYHEKTGPVLDFFKADDRARVVDSNRDPEAVFADVVAALDGVFTPREANATEAAPAVDLSEYKVVHILGGPGAGKGTQGEKIVAKY
eukprot:gene18078-9087_t